ncbi:hypothetical protein BBJ28_00019058 [Nothophytophthora sp. Chile5]|nr:hypothetical protein BBJ28_00019058 [Nothophytophthora sp. Chile5]
MLRTMGIRLTVRRGMFRLRLERGLHGNPARVEQPEVPVVMPTGPTMHHKATMVASHDPEIYPLVLCVSVGVSLGVISCVRHLLKNPDVNLSRHRRETPAWERYNAEESEQFTRARHHLANLRPNPINTYPACAKKLHENADKL